MRSSPPASSNASTGSASSHGSGGRTGRRRRPAEPTSEPLRGFAPCLRAGRRARADRAASDEARRDPRSAIARSARRRGRPRGEGASPVGACGLREERRLLRPPVTAPASSGPRQQGRGHQQRAALGETEQIRARRVDRDRRGHVLNQRARRGVQRQRARKRGVEDAFARASSQRARRREADGSAGRR